MSDEVLRARVENYMHESSALTVMWQRPITAQQLQAELDRMAAQSRAPDVLREIFEALGNDPRLIAETLARQALADRLIRNWYASDDRFHGNLERLARAARAACADVSCMKTMGGEYKEAKWIRRSQDDSFLPTSSATQRGSDDVPRLELSPEDWARTVKDLSSELGGAVDALLTGEIGSVVERSDSFHVRAVVSQAPGTITTAQVTWSKRSFEDWWSRARTSFDARSATATSAFVLPTPALAACVNDTWSMVPVPPSPREHHVAVWTGSEMIVAGGYPESFPWAIAELYNPATDTWRQATNTNAPQGVDGMTAVWTGSEMILWGGESGFNAGARYNPASDTWISTRVDANTPSPRGRHTAVWTGTEMIVWGGHAGMTYFADGGRYKPSTDSWIPIIPFALAARSLHSAVWTGTEMIVWGGWNGSTYFSDGNRFHINQFGQGVWSFPPFGAGAPPGRAGHSAVWTGSQMIVWGGYNESVVNSGGRYAPSTNTWLPTSTGIDTPSARHLHTAVWTGSRMIVWGGRDDDFVRTNTGGRYDPVSDTWTPTSTGASAPSSRIFHTTVWTGSEMIVFAGYPLPMPANTGGRYNPATDTWLPTSTTAAYAANHLGASSVWTGTEVIVWGGVTNEQTNTGSRYNLSTNAWIATSTGPGVPSARTGHAAVWTGREMVVWGGAYYLDRLSNGSRYDPSLDTWTPISNANAPAARSLPINLWTGTEMIVWGGSPSTNTGARYRPSTDSWAPTSTGPHVPPLGDFYSGVWTGSEMMVWEGFYPGGRYDPLTDAWSEPSMVDAPEGGGNPIVWTGADVIVWGGTSPSGPVNTGGLYHPSTDTWSPTSTGPDVPTPRVSSSAVWTGDEMLIWGGSPVSGDARIGGRYRPSTNTWTPMSSSAGTVDPAGASPALWTGHQLLTFSVGIGGLYCACPNGRAVYRDADWDGFGVAGVATPSCDGSIPAGYVANDLDCSDTNASVRPGGVESCNGLDDDCNGTADDGIGTQCDDTNPCTTDACGGLAGCTHAPNTSSCDDGNACTTSDVCGGGACGGTPLPLAVGDSVRLAGVALLAWEPATGSDTSSVLRGLVSGLPVGATPASETCLASRIPAATEALIDPDLPPAGDAFWYLVRGEGACGVGPYGYRTNTGGGPIAPEVSAACP